MQLHEHACSSAYPRSTGTHARFSYVGGTLFRALHWPAIATAQRLTAQSAACASRQTLRPACIHTPACSPVRAGERVWPGTVRACLLVRACSTVVSCGSQRSVYIHRARIHNVVHSALHRVQPPHRSPLGSRTSEVIKGIHRCAAVVLSTPSARPPRSVQLRRNGDGAVR